MSGNIHGNQNWEEGDSIDKAKFQEHCVGKGSHLRRFLVERSISRTIFYYNDSCMRIQRHCISGREIKKMKEKTHLCFKTVKDKWWHYCYKS